MNIMITRAVEFLGRMNDTSDLQNMFAARIGYNCVDIVGSNYGLGLPESTENFGTIY
jgi:hypothetical protein